MSGDALYLVDGSGFIFRAYHALPPLTTKGGVPSGAVYGFTQMLMKLEFDHRPSHLAVVFDAGAKSFRDNLYADYKANRTEPPDDLKPQFGLVRKVVGAFGIPMLEATGFEADDLIATLTRRAREQKMRVVIVSSDKDLMQLVDESCVLVDTMKDFVYGPAEVEAKFGVPPAKVGDVLALMGDSVDNVPGVPGIGPKTASQLIREFGSLDSLLGNLAAVGQSKSLRGAASVAAKLAAHVADAKLSRQLVSLDEQVKVDIPLESLRRHQPEMDKVETILVELEFTRLLERMRGREKTAPAKEPGGAPKAAATTTAIGKTPPEVLLDDAGLALAIEKLGAAKELGLALEPSGTSAMSSAIIGLSFAAPSTPSLYLPLGHRYLGVERQLETKTALDRLRPLLESASLKKHVHNVKDAHVLFARHGITLAGVVSDPMIASYLADPADGHDLASISKKWLDASVEDRDVLCGSGKKAVLYESIPIERAAKFAACEAEATLYVGRRLREEINGRGQAKLLDDLELPLARVLSVMERHGVRLDVPLLHRLGENLGEKLHAIEKEVQQLTGAEINLGSPKQLQDLLFGKLGLPGTKRTKTGFSTDAEVLEELAPLHPVAAKILEHRTLSKLKSTYIDTLPHLVDPRSGRLHTSYKQTTAATGRLSSTDPNLQNVPIRTELGREIRRAFVADAGFRLVVGDYSQIELRVLAHLSGDPVLTDAFVRDQDIHKRTVAEMFGEARQDDPDLRRVAKMINYGIIYGLSDFGLAQRLGIERADAKKYIDGYLKTYAGVASYMEKQIEEARRKGGSETILGRFRPLPELASQNRTVRMYGERMARNTPIQGSAADLLKMAMIAVQDYIDRQAQDVRMLLTVHDELVLEAPEDKAESASQRLKQVMEEVMSLAVPLKVDLGIGSTWADAK